MNGTRLCGVGLAALIALGATAPSGAKVRKAGPFRYVSETTNIASGGGLAWDATCPDGSRLTGGGGSIAGPPSDVTMTSSFPLDGADAGSEIDDVWRAETFNDTASSKQAWVDAVCLRTGTGGSQLDYASDGNAIGAGNISTFAGATCSGRVVGGGANLPGNPANEALNSTFPLPPGGDGTPTNQWSARVRSSNGPTTLFGFAICLPQGAMKFRYRTTERIIFGGQNRRAVAKCPAKGSWRVAGGGMRGVFLTLSLTRPWDSGDKGKAPDDGWVVKAGLPSPFSDPVVVQAWAVCVKNN